MSLGERCTLAISSDYGYGAKGYPGSFGPANIEAIDQFYFLF